MAGKAGKFWGQFADAFIPGNAYRPEQGGWNKPAVITGLARLGGGLVAGPLGGMVAGGIANASQGLPVTANMFRDYNGGNIAGIQRQSFGYQPSMNVPDVSMQIGGPVQASSPMGQMMAGPSMNAWDQRMADAMGGISGRINAAYAAQPAYNATQGVRDRGQGHTGEAAQSMFASLSDASRFNSTPQSFGDYTQRWT